MIRPWPMAIAVLGCVASIACEDARPATVPGTRGEREALAGRWNSLEARLEADNEARVHARLTPDRDAALSADIVRAAAALHDAHRAIEHTHLALPEQARVEMIDRAHAALDEAEASLTQADAIRASALALDVDAGPPAPDAPRTEGILRSVDGVQIHYVSLGSERTAVVLVHCWGCDSGEWQATMSHLAPRVRVVALDLAGHGASGRDRKQWTIHAFADDVRSVVEGLGLEHVVLVGHSMGGPVVVEAALAMPGRVVGLVPVDTLLDVSQQMTPEQRAKFFGPMHTDFKAQTEKLVRGLFPKQSDPAIVERVVAMEIAGDPAILVPAIEDAFAYPEAERLAQLKIPVHAVNADLFPTNVEGNRKVLPGYEATIVHGVGHWLMLEKPAEFAAALDEALAKMPL